MTCIVGIEQGGKVYIGGDSAGVSGWQINIRADEKVFRNGPFVLGFTSSFRMGQLLRYSLAVPEQTSTQDDYAFMCTTFVNAARACLKTGGFAEVNNGVETGGQFLVGYHGALYCVHSDFQVARTACGLATLGCGNELALGALCASTLKDPTAKVTQALTIAEANCAGVRGPFVVMS